MSTSAEASRRSRLLGKLKNSTKRWSTNSPTATNSAKETPTPELTTPSTAAVDTKYAISPAKQPAVASQPVPQPPAPEPAKAPVDSAKDSSANPHNTSLPTTVAPSQSPPSYSAVPLPTPTAPQVTSNPASGKPQKLDLWTQAISKLPPNDQLEAVFLSPAVDNRTALENFTNEVKTARDTCRDKQWRFEWKGKKIIIRDVADKVLVWVSKFKEIGDIVVNIDPCALQDPENMGYIMLGIERVSNILARCAVYETLYLPTVGEKAKSAMNLEQSILGLYTAILNFHIKSKAYLADNTLVRSLSSILSPNEFSSLMEDIDHHDDTVVKDVQACQIETSAAEFQNLRLILSTLEQPITRIDSTLTQIKDGLDTSRRTKILTWLSTIEYRRHHNRSNSGITKGTCEWLLKHEKFTEWQGDSSSGILWLNGDPGTGKTKLTSHVVQYLLDDRKKRGSDEAVAYFYCDRSDQRTREPEEILRAILKQLAFVPPDLTHIHPDLISEYETRENTGFSSGGLEVDASVDLITKITDMYPLTSIIIDALDEVDRENRQIVIKALKTIAQDSKSLVKLFVSSRKEKDITFHFKHVSNHYISPGDNTADIEAFIDSEIQRRVEDGSLDLETAQGTMLETLHGNIKSALKSDARGMFLWVDLQIKNLCNLHHENDVEDTLRKLPEGLDRTYDVVVESILKEKGQGRQIAISTLRWLLLTKQPMTINELLGALYWSGEGGSTIVISQEFVLTVCHNLVSVHRSPEDTEPRGDVVRFSHLSAREYLETSRSSNLAFFEESVALESIVATSFRCLDNLPSFDRTASETQTAFVDYALAFSFDYVGDMDHLGWKESLTDPIQQFGGFLEGSISPACEAALRMNWKMSFERKFSSEWRQAKDQLMLSLLEARELSDEERRGWPLYFAIALGVPRFIEDTIKAHPDIIFSSYNGYSSLYHASARGFLPVVTILLDTLKSHCLQNTPELGEKYGNMIADAIWASAKFDNWAVTQHLAHNCQVTNPEYLKPLFKRILLAYGEDKLLEILLDEHIPFPGSFFEDGTVLHNHRFDFGRFIAILERADLHEVTTKAKNFCLREIAARRKDRPQIISVLKLLIQIGADDLDNALVEARKWGGPKTVQFLLENGAKDQPEEPVSKQ